MYPDIQLSALDISEEMVKEARSRLIQGGSSMDDAVNGIVAGDAENMPFVDEEFEAVTCNMSIHHYPDPQKAVNEMFRILEPGGYLLINDMDCIAPIRGIANIVFPHMKGGDVKMYNRGEILHMLKVAGLTRFKYRKISPFSFLCVAVK